MAKNLVIVESPAKAKTLKKFLGSSYKIEASVGHVRDLPKSELGINIDNDFEPKYITIRGKGQVLAKLRKEVKLADKVYLATDPDREGEAISWHLLQALKLDEKKASRITFNEITKNAVRKSIKEARQIDMDLVDAQQARRELDRVVGYKISPLLWKKVKKGLSAGRVQSVALKIICDREDEVENFVKEEYWSLAVNLESNNGMFEAKLSSDDNGKIELKNKGDVDKITKYIKKQKFVVQTIKVGTRTKKTIPPFTTSTLQQEASKLLGFATYKTMMIAQQLYEGIDIKGEGTVGMVSYIRTDSIRISDEAFEDVKSYVIQNFGENYAVEEKVEYKNKGKSQDAHEAVRPTSSMRDPQSVKESLTKDQFKLYKLIWERFVASQMKPAIYDTISAKINSGKYIFRGSGSILKFSGFLSVYKKNIEKEEDSKIPKLEEGETLTLNNVLEEQHFTQPPARFTEAMLVKTMEELGIGRPSTYAATIRNIVTRRYVIKDTKIFYATELGEIVNDIMKNNFEDIVDIGFTAKMEQDLDKVEEGLLEWKEVLRRFYPRFAEQILLAEEKIGEIQLGDEETDVICENCEKNMVIKYSKYGKFLACPGFPDCRNTKTFFEEAGVNCPKCESRILIKKTKKGRKYYGCENNPECEFMSWSKPTGKLCPECGDILVEKGTKNKKIVCSRTTCSHTEELEDED
jgi:DNA topoisomerase I